MNEIRKSKIASFDARAPTCELWNELPVDGVKSRDPASGIQVTKSRARIDESRVDRGSGRTYREGGLIHSHPREVCAGSAHERDSLRATLAQDGKRSRSHPVRSDATRPHLFSPVVISNRRALHWSASRGFLEYRVDTRLEPARGRPTTSRSKVLGGAVRSVT